MEDSQQAAPTMAERRPRQPWAVTVGISGMLFPILLFLGKSSQPEDFPYQETSDAAWIRYLAAGEGRFRMGFFFEGLAWMAFVIFVLGLAAWLIGQRESDRALGWIAAGAGLVLTVVSLVPFILLWPLTWDDTLRTPAIPMRTMALMASVVAGNGAFGFMAFPQAVLTGAVGMYLLRTRGLAMWVAWFSIALAVLSAIHTLEVLAPEVLGVVHMPGFFGFLLWPLFVGAALLLRAFRPAATRPPPVPAG